MRRIAASKWLNRSMRIALIAPPWTPIPPPLYGGIELVVDQMARGLVAAGQDITLFTTGDSTCPVPEGLGRSSTPRGCASAWPCPSSATWSTPTKPSRDYDVVHDHTVMGPFYAERYPDLPVVTTIHGPFNDELTDLYRVLAPRVPIVGHLPRPAPGRARHPDRPGDPSRARRVGLPLR